MIEAGINDYLPKPVSRRQLLAMIEKWTAKDNDNDGAVRLLASGPVLNDEVIVQLANDTSPDPMPELVNAFVAIAEERYGAIEAAFGRDDLDGVEGEAHSLKEAARTFGARRLANLAEFLDENYDAGDRAAVGQAIFALGAEGETARRALKSYLFRS